VSIQDLQQNPQDTSNFYLANIYQATIHPNEPNISLPTSPPPFSPPNYAVWVNALWFLSLAISLTCALLATFLQQWARRYLKITHSRYSLHKRARIRAFFAEGVEKCLLPWAVDILPTLLHISLFLFFAGLAVFLSNVNITIFKLVLSWIGICTALYGCITLMPILRHDSPYYTSLSSSAWNIVIGLACIVSLVSWILLYFTACWRRGGEWLLNLAISCLYLLSQGMQKTVEKTALKSSSEIDTRAFMWTFDVLDEDHELERFFSGLPGLRSSKVVADPLPTLTWEQKRKLGEALMGLMERTFSSDVLPAPVKERRAMICVKAIDPVHIYGTVDILHIILSNCQYSGPLATVMVQSARSWRTNPDQDSLPTQAAISMIVARVQLRDDSWFVLASSELAVSEAVLRGYTAHGDSLSLAVLIHLIRQQCSYFGKESWPEYAFSKVLEEASKFNVLDTSPELQHEFCALWNEVLRGDHRSILVDCVLKPIRNVYLTLHLHTDCVPTRFSASTPDFARIFLLRDAYPTCNIPGHRSVSTPHTHDVSAPMAIALPDPLDNIAQTPAPLSSTPDASASSPPEAAPDHMNDNTIDAPLLDNHDSSALASIHHAQHPAAESLDNSATSPDQQAAAGGTLDIGASARSIPPATIETSTSASSVPPTDKISSQDNTNLLIPSDAPEISSPASPDPVLNDITGPSLSLTLMIDFRHSTSFIDSHFSILATTSPGTSPWPTTAPDLDTAEGAGSHEDKDALGPPSVNRAIQANTTAILERPPAPPTLPSAADMTIASPSQQEFGAEHAGDPPPHAPHGTYGIM
jgi:hypothetical protein